MEIIKRKILVSDIVEGENLYFKIPINQSFDDIGILSDMPYSENSGISSIKFGTDTNIYELRQYELTSDWFVQSGVIISATDSKIERVRGYNSVNPFVESFDIRKKSYINYLSEVINGVDRITKINGDEVIYTVDAKKDSNIGTSNQTSGILYTDNPVDGVKLPSELDRSTTTTKIQFFGEGWNETNMSLDPQIKEEYLFGIINSPEVKTDVFIDRSTFSVIDNHLRLSEVESLDHLVRYGNGFYNINKD